MQLTITEALAELKLIDKKIEKKQEFICSYMTRQNSLVDPLGDSGGSRKVLEQERQAIGDLLKRKVDIRRAIHETNASTQVTVNGETRSLADWLIWRREAAPVEQAFLRTAKQKIDAARNQAAQQRAQLVSAEKNPESATDIVVNISERKLAERAEQIETILGVLDGQLSLKNATVMVTL